MPLNIKDPETEALAAELAKRLGTSKTGAVRQALRAQLSALRTRDSEADRLDRVTYLLKTEIWPLTTGGDPLTKREREQILGYGNDGV